MPRYAYQSHFVDGNGTVVLGGSVTVYLSGTDTLATIYAASSGGSAIANSEITTSSTDGSFKFFVDTADYATSQTFRIKLSKNIYKTQTYDDISILRDNQTTIADYGNDLTAAVTAIGATETDLVIDSASTVITGNTTVPANINLVKTRDGLITGAFTLTINGGMSGDLTSQWFASNVTVSLSAARIPYVSPSWFGALSSASAAVNAAAFNAAAAAKTSDVIFLILPGSYSVSASVVFAGTRTKVVGWGVTLTGNDVSGYVLDVGSQTAATVRFALEGITIVPTGTTTGAISISDIANFDISQVRLQGLGVGIRVRGGCYMSTIRNSRIQGNNPYFDTAVKVESSTSGNVPNSLKLQNVWGIGGNAGSKGFWVEAGGGINMTTDNCYWQTLASHGIHVENGSDFTSNNDTFEGCGTMAELDGNRASVVGPTSGAGNTNGIIINGNYGEIKVAGSSTAPSGTLATIAGSYGTILIENGTYDTSADKTNRAYQLHNGTLLGGNQFAYTTAQSLTNDFIGINITNEGASGTLNHTLRACSLLPKGSRFTFTRLATQTLRATPASGDTILGASAADKYIELGSDGASVTLEVVDTTGSAGKYRIVSSYGTISFQA